MGTVIGYARVSTVGQSLDVQLAKLKEYGCDKIYKDKHTGTTADRPELKKCRDYLREGDKLVITRLDRLARSTFHLCQIREELIAKGVELVVLDQSIDTTTHTGRLMFDMLAAIAEFETALRKERQLEGIAKAKERGVYIGRKAKLSDGQVRELKEKREAGAGIKELMAEFGLSRASVYRLLGS